MRSDVKTFHVPLPPAIYDAVRVEAERAGRTATAVARQAIEDWLSIRRKMELHEEIAGYAAAHRGTDADLDPALATAAARQLRKAKR